MIVMTEQGFFFVQEIIFTDLSFLVSHQISSFSIQPEVVLGTFTLFSAYFAFYAIRAEREEVYNPFFRDYPHLNHSAKLPLKNKFWSGRFSLDITF